jgi:hypothetical protein
MPPPLPPFAVLVRVSDALLALAGARIELALPPAPPEPVFSPAPPAPPVTDWLKDRMPEVLPVAALAMLSLAPFPPLPLPLLSLPPAPPATVVYTAT